MLYNFRLTISLFVIFVFSMAFSVASTLNIAGLLNVDAIYDYANILLGALIPIVLLALGFALARYIVGFVLKIFNNLGG